MNASVRLFSDQQAFEWQVLDRAVVNESAIARLKARSDLAARLRSRICYPEIPSVDALHLPESRPSEITLSHQASPGLASPLLEEARAIALVEDFKPLSDLVAKNLSGDELTFWASEFEQLEALKNTAENYLSARRLLLQRYLDSAYQTEPSLANAPDTLFKAHTVSEARSPALAYIEALWPALCKVSVPEHTGSLLPTPYPFLIPAGRFTESYYWDTGFGVEGLLACGHLEAAQMQADNLLEQIRRFGFVPNGNRDYYLSRSQPPLSSRVIRAVAEATQQRAIDHADQALADKLNLWLVKRAIPLLALEFVDFWSDENRRFDRNTGLHHHWDELDSDRPERYSTDDENGLGKSLRDVRAMAESGLDFTEVYNGASSQNEMTNFAPVLLNALLAGFAEDIAQLCSLCSCSNEGADSELARFTALAAQRRAAIDQNLWDESAGYYRSLNLETGKHSRGIDFTTFTPLYVGIASTQQAQAVARSAERLIKHGGLASSSVMPSRHQWDGNNGWAPAQMMAVGGLLHYATDNNGLAQTATTIATRWTDTLAGIHQKHGGFYERIDVEACDLPPRAAHQYPVQQGFLWTNASYVWMLNRIPGLSGNRERPADAPGIGNTNNAKLNEKVE